MPRIFVKKKHMRFKLDECIHISIKKILNDKGFETDTIYEENKSGISDSETIKLCKKEKRMLITVDKGFGNILKYPKGTHGGIILLRPKKTSMRHIKNLITSLGKFLLSEKKVKIKGALIIIDAKGRIRIR